MAFFAMSQRPGGGTFPTVEERQTSTSSATTSHAITVSSGGAVAGELLVAAISQENGGGFTWPVGWTELFDVANGANASLSVGYKVAAGGETSVTVTSGTSGSAAHRAWRISGAGTVPEAGTAATGTSTAPDPPSLTPSWGSASTLWLAVEAHKDENVTGYPSGYSNTVEVRSGGSILGAAEMEQSGSTENPGAFTIDNSAAWVANTVAIEPA